MSIFLNEKDKLDINILREYNGKDEVIQILSANYQDIQKRFFSKGLPVIFSHPNIKKGVNINQVKKTPQGDKVEPATKAISQESLPWKVTIKTKTGDMPVRYCEVAEPQQFGGFKFSPSHIDIITPRWTYFEQDIDKILVLMLTGHYKQGIISIVDTNADATKLAEDRGRSGAVSFHIFTEGGDLYGDEGKLDKFCLGWGIGVKGKFENQKKIELADAIQRAEIKHDNDFGIDAFKSALRDLDPYLEIRSSIQDSLEKNLIRYESKKYNVVFANGEILLKIPIDKSNDWRKVLVEYISKNPDKLDILQNSNENAPLHERRKIETPDVMTEEFIMEQSYPNLKILVAEITGLAMREMKTMKMPELQEQLIKHYITDKKNRP